MPRKVGRSRPDTFVQDALRYLASRAQKLSGESEVKKYRPSLSKAVTRYGKPEETTGHIVRLFPEPMEVSGKTFIGMELRCTPGDRMIDPDAAETLAKRKKIDHLVTHTETVWDYDMFSVLQQQGKLSEEEFDSIWVTGEDKFALWPKEA